MRLHAPSIDDKELPVTMNPGSGKPLGFIHFGNTHHCAELVIHDDADADRIIRAAAKLKAMRAQLGKPHPFTSAEWSGPSGGHCDLCGMLGDSPDHAAPASCGHPANEDGECDCSSWPERAALAAWAAEPEPQGAPCAESCPGHGLSCTQGAPHELPHACPRGCQFGEGTAALAAAGPEPVPLFEALERVRPMEARDLRAALVTIGQHHPGVFREVVGLPAGPAFTAAAPAGRYPCCEHCAPGCETPDRHQIACIDCPPPEPEPEPPARCPGCNADGGHAPWCKRAAKLAELGAQVRHLSRPASPAGRHALAVAR